MGAAPCADGAGPESPGLRPMTERPCLAGCVALLCGMAFGAGAAAFAGASDAAQDIPDAASPAAQDAAANTAAEVDAATVRRLYRRSCKVCHALGAAGAYRTGDAEAWAPVMEKGIAALAQSVRNGLGAMPPGGLCPRCTDDELRALIRFLSAPR